MIPPEHRLVLLTAAGTWADEPICDLLGERLRWPMVYHVARLENAVPEVYRRLLKSAGSHGQVGGGSAFGGGAAEALFGDVAEAFRRTSAVVDFQMGLLQNRLLQLLERYDAAGIDVVLLKGSGIALERLGGLNQRPMGDLDLLLRPEQAREAHDLAQELEWEIPRSDLRPHMYEGHHHLIQLDAADGLSFSLEVHTDLFPEWGPFRFGGAEIWERARPLSSNCPEPVPPSAFVPSPEHQLLHASLHFAWSHFFRSGTWRMIRDVEALLADPGLDLGAFIDQARACRGATCAYWTFLVFQTLTGRSVPTGLLKELQVEPRQVLRRPLLRHLTQEALVGPARPGTQRLGRWLWTLAIDPSGSGHGPGRPWTGLERWPGPTEEERARMPPRPGWWSRLLGMGRHLAYVLAGRRFAEPRP